MTKVRNIAILTSGGDAQGMNACIRSITRLSLFNNIKVIGVKDGYNGLIDNDFIELEYNDVSNIIQRGGTILGTARCERFFKKEFREKAFKNVLKLEIDAIIIIGGDGSFKGAKLFHEEFNIPFIGIPGTIDNDIAGTDYTLGFDTALNNIINAVDKIKDTASSHHRIFLVEVMGNKSGLLALNSALTTGAEDVFIPESKENYEVFEGKIKKALASKKSSIIIVSEGDEIGGAKELYEYLKSKKLHEKIRVSILGHIQRGGAPTFLDRKLGTDFGCMAVETLIAGEKNKLVGLNNGKVMTYEFTNNITKIKPILKSEIDKIHHLSLF